MLRQPPVHSADLVASAVVDESCILVSLVFSIRSPVAWVHRQEEEEGTEDKTNVLVHGCSILDELFSLLGHVDARKHAGAMVLQQFLLRGKGQLSCGHEQTRDGRHRGPNPAAHNLCCGVFSVDEIKVVQHVRRLGNPHVGHGAIVDVEDSARKRSCQHVFFCCWWGCRAVNESVI